MKNVNTKICIVMNSNWHRDGFERDEITTKLMVNSFLSILFLSALYMHVKSLNWKTKISSQFYFLTSFQMKWIWMKQRGTIPNIDILNTSMINDLGEEDVNLWKSDITKYFSVLRNTYLAGQDYFQHAKDLHFQNIATETWSVMEKRSRKFVRWYRSTIPCTKWYHPYTCWRLVTFFWVIPV